MIMPLWYFRSLREAEVDGQPVGDQTPPDDYTTDGEQYTDDQSAPPPGGNPQTGEQSPPYDGSQPPEEPPTDYTEGMDNGNPEGTQAGALPEQQPEVNEVDDLKRQEEELYAELTPQQLNIKHKELKAQYLNMYDSVVSIIDRLSDINAAEENLKIVEYVSNTLSNLKDMLSDYVNDVYQTKSYIENSINYNRFLAILNGINKILEEMNSKNDEN